MDASQLPPHFHRDDRISEKDILPDGDYLNVVPDYPASEGTEVSYFDGANFKRYRMVSGVWRQIGVDRLVASHDDDEAVNTVTISELDLDSDRGYKILLRASNATISDLICLRLNDDSSAKYYGRLWGNSSAFTYSAENKVLVTNQNTDNRIIQSELLLTKHPGYPTQVLAQSTMWGATAAAPDLESSGWAYTSTANITSLRFYTFGGYNYSWNIWIYKMN